MEVTDFYKANISEATVYTKTSTYSVYQVTVAVLTVKLHVTIVLLSMFLTQVKRGEILSVLCTCHCESVVNALFIKTCFDNTEIFYLRGTLHPAIAKKNGQSENLRMRTSHRKPPPPPISPCKISKGDMNNYFGKKLFLMV